MQLAALLLAFACAATAENHPGPHPQSRCVEIPNGVVAGVPPACRQELARSSASPAASLAGCKAACQNQGPSACAGDDTRVLTAPGTRGPQSRLFWLHDQRPRLTPGKARLPGGRRSLPVCLSSSLAGRVHHFPTAARCSAATVRRAEGVHAQVDENKIGAGRRRVLRARRTQLADGVPCCMRATTPRASAPSSERARTAIMSMMCGLEHTRTERGCATTMCTMHELGSRVHAHQPGAGMHF